MTEYGWPDLPGDDDAAAGEAFDPHTGDPYTGPPPGPGDELPGDDGWDLPGAPPADPATPTAADPYLPDPYPELPDDADPPGAGEHGPPGAAEHDPPGAAEYGPPVGADPDAVGEPGHPPQFPPVLDVGPLPEPVDGFPWIDTASLGAAGPVTADAAAGGAPTAQELAAHAAVDLPPGVDPWTVLQASDDPATAALARFYQPGSTGT